MKLGHSSSSHDVSGTPRSAEWLSAISPIGNRLVPEQREAGCQPAIQPIASRRYVHWPRHNETAAAILHVIADNHD